MPETSVAILLACIAGWPCGRALGSKIGARIPLSGGVEKAVFAKIPGTCVDTAGPEVAVAQIFFRGMVDRQMGAPTSQLTLLAADDGARKDVGLSDASLFRALLDTL